MLATVTPFPQYFGLDGSPLDGGRVFFGQPGLNPETAPITVYWDAAGTQPAVQPVPTRRGYLARSGNVANVYAAGNYSISVRDRLGGLVYYARDSSEFSNSVALDGDLAELRVDLLDVASPSKGAALVGFGSTVTYPAGTVGGALMSLRGRSISPRTYGAVLDGVANDTAAIQEALNAANGTGKTVVIDGPACLLSSGLSQVNHSHYNVDWGQCRVQFNGAAGTYLLDMEQAGRINHCGGVFAGSGANHLLRTKGSATAQASAFPAIPNEDQWSRQLSFVPSVASGFLTVLDLGNFTREVWIGGYITGNRTAVKVTGKVVNVFARKGTVLYSSLASSQALVCRGDAADATYRYAEGLFFGGVIMDTVGTPLDARDFYLLDIGGAQIKAGAGGIAVDITKGVCPLTREIFMSHVLMQGQIRLGAGLASQHLFSLQASAISFSDTADTALQIGDYCKGVMVNGASFNTPTGTPRMFSIGANCAAIRVVDLNSDAGTYTNAPTIDATSLAGVEAEFTAPWTPGIAFGGASVGVAYSSRGGRYSMRGGQISAFFEIALSNKGSSVGAATITGLPFPCQLVDGTGVVGRYTSMNTGWTPMLSVSKTASAINVKAAGGGSDAAFSNTDFSNSTVLNGSVVYPVS